MPILLMVLMPVSRKACVGSDVILLDGFISSEMRMLVITLLCETILNHETTAFVSKSRSSGRIPLTADWNLPLGGLLGFFIDLNNDL